MRVDTDWLREFGSALMMCHRCESGLVDGAVDYQPDPLECPAEGNLLICCSRPRSDVVIDL